MEPIVLVGAIIVAFGLWLELWPVIQQAGNAIFNSSIVVKLTAACTEQNPSYQANAWLGRKAG